MKHCTNLGSSAADCPAVDILGFDICNKRAAFFAAELGVFGERALVLI